MTKILQMGKYFPPFYGGVETVTYDLYEHFNDESLGCKMDVLYFCDRDDLSASLSYKKNAGTLYPSVKKATVSSAPISMSYFSIWAKIRNFYDVIHVHFPNPIAAFCLFLFPVNSKAKVIVHWHSDIYKQKYSKIFFKFFQDFVLKRADVIVVTSKNYMEFSHDLKRFKKKCEVIPIGVKPVMKIDLRDEGFFLKKYPYQGKKVVLSIGRLTSYKGFEYLIKSALYLSEEYVILIAGSGELYNSLNDLIKSLSLQGKVKLLGKVSHEDLVKLYNFADVFCLPSIYRSEAFGLVQAEAMSLSIPVVSTNIIGSGVNWVNKDGVSGVTVSPRQPKSLADAIIEVSSHRNKYSLGAISRYNQFFSSRVMLDSFKNLYKS